MGELGEEIRRYREKETERDFTPRELPKEEPEEEEAPETPKAPVPRREEVPV